MNEFQKTIGIDELWDIVDHLHDEIMVYDNNYNLVYVNQAAERHYGKKAEELIGKSFSDLDETYWGNSTLPEVYEKKTMVAKRQITNLGQDIITISVPIFDENGNIKYVAQNVNDIYMQNRIGQAEQKFVSVTKGKKKQEKEFVYASKQMDDVFQMLYKIRNVESPCLLLGETGTGKSFLAKRIHDTSKRSKKPFVAVNCACMSPTLIESELFGYKKGAFSGANANGKKGIVELADGGTLFLDEISEIPYDLQGKLLLFIQDQEFLPLGSEKKQSVDVKIIAATNRSLKQMVEMGTLRKDLYYRLSSFEVVIPPIRERPEDIQVLLTHFLQQYNHFHGKNKTLSKDAKELLMQYTWPGNVRELSHTMEKTVVLASQDEIRVSDLPKNMFDITTLSTQSKSYGDVQLEDALEELERKIILEVYEKHKTSVQVGKVLGISQPKAYRLIQKYLQPKD